MEISLRDLLTVVHGMGFGALFMMAFSGAIAILWQMASPGAAAPGPRSKLFLNLYLSTMVILAWGAVLSGTYLIYPWYRALPPPGANLSLYPKALLLSSHATALWHTMGMEWKEHIGWLAPIAMTMVAYVFGMYGASIRKYRSITLATFVFVMVAFFATGVAGAFGAFLNKYAPVRGGPEIQLIQESQP